MELLLREIPSKAEDVRGFHCFTSCAVALLRCSRAARAHRREELWQVMSDLRQDDRLEPAVREDCQEARSGLGGGWGAVSGCIGREIGLEMGWRLVDLGDSRAESADVHMAGAGRHASGLNSWGASAPELYQVARGVEIACC